MTLTPGVALWLSSRYTGHRARPASVQPSLRSPKSPPLPAAELTWAGSNQLTPALSAPNPIVRMFPQHSLTGEGGGGGGEEKRDGSWDTT